MKADDWLGEGMTGSTLAGFKSLHAGGGENGDRMGDSRIERWIVASQGDPLAGDQRRDLGCPHPASRPHYLITATRMPISPAPPPAQINFEASMRNNSPEKLRSGNGLQTF